MLVVKSRIKRALGYYKQHGFRETIKKFNTKLFRYFRRKLVMSNYYGDLSNRVGIYQRLYETAPKKTIIRLLWWNCKALLKRQIPFDDDIPGNTISKESEKLGLSANRLNIGFCLHGGLGDKLIACNYIYCLKKKYQAADPVIDIFLPTGFSSSKTLIDKGTLCRECFQNFDKDVTPRSYDLFINLVRYPEVLNYNEGKLKRLEPGLYDYAVKCREFADKYPHFFRFVPYFDGQSAIFCELNGKKRINQPDFDDLLSVGKEYTYQVPLQEDEQGYLNTLGLKSGIFITMHRGVDPNFTDKAVKMWPHTYYETLAKLIKHEYPDVTVVQMGISHDRCPHMQGVDMDVVGETTLEQVKILLKHSLLHIDCEGGFVHLRRALKAGKSIVMFGPTSKEFFGYDFNLNLTGGGCLRPCEWVTTEWADKCLRGFDDPPCMWSITPELVMEKIKQEIRKSGACVIV